MASEATEPTERQVFAAALASLPRCTPTRLRVLLAARPALSEVWTEIVAGRATSLPGVTSLPNTDVAKVVGDWERAAAALDLEQLAGRLTRGGVRVRVLGDSDYPRRLGEDPNPPGVVFERSAHHDVDDVLEHPTVAIVGTRRCTSYGRDVAAHLGRELSAAGVSIVSGLALGVDGAAHEGALAAGAAPPLAVVGSGPDVVYPRRHRRLWERVVEAGSVIGEAPLGAEPAASRFPLRNRIIVALADLVIVVESHAAGGSMITVQAAIERGVPVMAVPGSVRSPSSVGTNRLLSDGVAPVLDVDDVLVALALERPGSFSSLAPESQSRPQVDGADETVLAAVDWVPTRTEVVLQRTGLDLGPAASALTRLEMAGLVRSSGGAWERC